MSGIDPLEVLYAKIDIREQYKKARNLELEILQECHSTIDMVIKSAVGFSEFKSGSIVNRLLEEMKRELGYPKGMPIRLKHLTLANSNKTLVHLAVETKQYDVLEVLLGQLPLGKITSGSMLYRELFEYSRTVNFVWSLAVFEAEVSVTKTLISHVAAFARNVTSVDARDRSSVGKPVCG